MEKKYLDSVIEDEKKRLITIIFENALSVAYIRENNKEASISKDDISIMSDKQVELEQKIGSLQNTNKKGKHNKEIQELQSELGSLKMSLNNYFAIKNQWDVFLQRIKEASWQLDNINYNLDGIINEGKEFNRNEKV
jgi:hypothetical protein